MCMGVIDVYDLKPFSVALALTEGHKVSRKQNLLGSFFKHMSAVVAEHFDAAVEYGLCKQEKNCLCIGNP